jgi:2-keto-4-pentenoate hydratase/2-oxohepta-3-ene-1,7-dioic acid hydratase in catechol pathway
VLRGAIRHVRSLRCERAGIWARKPGDPRRQNPYLFLKSPTTVTDPFDPILMPNRAADDIFGYTIHIDVSDRAAAQEPSGVYLLLRYGKL